ncbi:MAG: hypothetical protein AB1331_00215 [Bacillota bacterium]
MADYDSQRRERARAYEPYRRRLTIVRTLQSLLLGGLFVASGLDRRLAAFTGYRGRGSALLYIAIAALAYLIIDSLVGFTMGYRPARAFGLSIQTPAAWWGDRVKHLILGLGMALLAGGTIHLLLVNCRPAG